MAVDLLGGLGDNERRATVAKMTRRAYRSGDTLFFEGDPGDTLHIVQKGRVAIRTSTPGGDEATLTVLGPGQSFGELALLNGDSRRTASAVALEAVETRALHRNDFEELRQAHPRVERLLVDILSAQVRRLTSQVLDALYVPAEQRVVRRLAELADVYSDSASLGTRGARIDISVRQEDIASMAGTTRPTANRVLQDLAAAGVLELRRGHTVILDVADLQRRAR